MIIKAITTATFILFVGLCMFTSCKEKKNEDITNQCLFVEDDDFSSCYFYNYESEPEIVIRNNESYQELKNSFKNPSEYLTCDTISLPLVDFSQYILVGQLSYPGGCGAKSEKKILLDKEDKTITYQVYHEYIGYCSSRWISMNWVMIPITDKNYSVNFVVETKNVNTN